VTVTETVKGGLITGASTVAGGLIAGPVGMAVGAAIGGVVAAARSYGKFESVASIIMNMDEKDKQKLYDDAMEVVKELDITDVAQLLLALQQQEARERLVDVIVKHVEGQLHMQITH
jgi:hypothetical protein